jgi:hypothetical protein
VIAGKHVPAEWVESDECVQLCGIERMTVGLSSDALFEPSFRSSPLCSLPCLNSCPNLRHLFSDLASGEGKFSSSPQFFPHQHRESHGIYTVQTVLRKPTDYKRLILILLESDRNVAGSAVQKQE